MNSQDLIEVLKALVDVCVEEYGEPDAESTVVGHAEVRAARQLIATLDAHSKICQDRPQIRSSIR